MLALSAAVTQPGVDASAAVKEVPLSTAIDDVYWTRQGDDSVYSQNEKQPVFKNDSGFTYISTCDTDKGDRSVYVEFNVVSFHLRQRHAVPVSALQRKHGRDDGSPVYDGEKSTGQHTGTAITTIGTTTFLRSAPPGAPAWSRIIIRFGDTTNSTSRKCGM